MPAWLAVFLGFPTAVFTVLLGVVGVYWLFVMAGALDVDTLGGGSADGALDGLADGALDGADGLLGASKGATEGLVGSSKGAAEGLAGHADGGGLASVVSALRLRSVPLTVTTSLVVVFAWLASALASHALGPSDGTAAATLLRVGVLVGAPVLALLPTSVLARPLAPLFRHAPAVAHKSLVGRVVRVRTGTVTERFGEATLDDGGAGLVLRVRVDPSPRLRAPDATPIPEGEAEGADAAPRRGDEVVIVDYDEARQEFVVAKLPDLGRG